PHIAGAMRLRFDGSGDYLSTKSPWDGQARFWDTGAGLLLMEALAFGSYGHELSSTGNLLLWRKSGERLEIWEFDRGYESRPLAHGQYPAEGDAFNVDLSADGRILAVGRQGGFELWGLVSRRRLAHFPADTGKVFFDDSGGLVVGA